MATEPAINWLDKLSDWGWELVSAVVLMVVGWMAKWKWKTDKDIADLKLHVSENYVKKSDINLLKEEIAAEFKDVKDSQAQILDVLLSRKIGTTARRR